MRRLLLFSGLAASVLLLAACSGGDAPTTAEYEEAVSNAADRTDYALNRVVQSKSADEFIKRMEEASVTIDQAAADLDELGAPEEFEQDNEKLVKALGDLGTDVGLTGEQAQDPVFREAIIGQATAGLSFESWDKVNLALGGLVGAGLNVKTLQRQTVDQTDQ